MTQGGVAPLDPLRKSWLRRYFRKIYKDAGGRVPPPWTPLRKVSLRSLFGKVYS